MPVAAQTINLMKLTSVAIPNPTAIPIKVIVANTGNILATAVLGVELKSKGNIDSKETMAANPNKFNTSRVAPRSKCLSIMITRMCPIMEKVRVAVMIGSQALKSAVKKFPAQAMLAEGNQGLVIVQPSGKTDQDRGTNYSPCSADCLPIG